MATLEIRTRTRCEFVDITDHLTAVLDANARLVHVHVPHTTAAITINEGFDPAVADDLLRRLEQLAPHLRDPAGRRDEHAEGNSDAHLKAALLGTSATIAADRGRLVLGRWQRVFLCEFDGPRTREVWVTTLTG